jgi:hypothetical protein
MKKAVSFSALFVLALLCGLWASRASAQAVYGSIAGTVTDPQGAAVVIPAKVGRRRRSLR